MPLATQVRPLFLFIYFFCLFKWRPLCVAKNNRQQLLGLTASTRRTEFWTCLSNCWKCCSFTSVAPCTITPLLSSCLHAVTLNQLFLASQRLLFSTLKKKKKKQNGKVQPPTILHNLKWGALFSSVQAGVIQTETSFGRNLKQDDSSCFDRVQGWQMGINSQKKKL